MDAARALGKEEQLKAIADPHRLGILRRLMARPETISGLGAAFGKHPAWIRHHVTTLKRVGLIELAETRRTRNYVEKFYRATAPAYSINLLLVPEYAGKRSIVAMGSDDLALETLASLTNAGREIADVFPIAVGSLDGLISLRQGLADIAGCHLLDADSGEYNVPYVRHLLPDRPVAVVTLAHREQGLIVAAGNPLAIRAVDDLARPNVKLVNRNPGSGTRLWLDRRLHTQGIATGQVDGYDNCVGTHTEAAAAVARGRADVGLGIRAAAVRMDLDFVPLFRERYDIVIPDDRHDDPRVSRFLNGIGTRAFMKAVRQLGGYDTDHAGHEEHVAV